MKGVAFRRGELMLGVVVDEFVFDRIDQDGFEGAAGALVVSAGADEVRIDPP